MCVTVENTLLLSQADIQQLITMRDVVAVCDETFKGFGEGTTINPAKVTLDLGESAPWPPYAGFMNSMPAYVGHLDTAGMKFVGGFQGERKELGLPFLTGLILLIDPHTGNFTAVLEGAYITNLRTGAQTAIALKYLYKTKAIRVGIYGAGAQGRTQIQAISEVFEIRQLRIYDIDREASRRFSQDMRDFVQGDIVIDDDPEQTAKSDAVITVTQARNKFLRRDWIDPGTTVFPMGSYQECEDALIINSDLIIVDHVQQALHRGALRELNARGEILESHIHATIGQLAAGKKEVTVTTERVLCIPIGTGALDIAVGQVILNRAKQQGLGTAFAFV